MTPEYTFDNNTLLVAKQPIFDLKGGVWGYELLFRGLRSDLMDGGGNKATSTIMIEGFDLLRPTLRPKQYFCINFTTDFLEAELPSVLPPDICVIEILENTVATETVLNGIINLKKQGYTIALDDYIGQPELESFLVLADIIKVEILNMSNEDILRIRGQLAGYPALLLAEKVETHTTAEYCRQLGFTLFQGNYFCKAEVVQGRKLTPTQMSRVRLLGILSNDDNDMSQLVKAVRQDMFLSYRLLKFINSVYFGLPTKASTIERAASLLGTKKMRQWLFINTLAEMDTSVTSQELMCISAYRAKFLETLVQSCSNDEHLASKLFMAGLFSLLQAILRVPMEDIFVGIPLSADVLQVLVGEGPLAPWFAILTAYENAEWDAVKRHSTILGVKDSDLALACRKAEIWGAAVSQTVGPH